MNKQKYSINLESFEKRKYNMQLNRKEIDIEIWEKYIEKNYPDWHKEKYQDKLPIRIIYYDKKSYGIFKLYLSKWTTITCIIKKLNYLIDCQFKMINRCFGIDISEHIKICTIILILQKNLCICINIYDININTNGYFLQDLHFIDINKGKYYVKQRWVLQVDTTINNIASKIEGDAILSRYITLRLKNNYQFKPQNFSGII